MLRLIDETKRKYKSMNPKRQRRTRHVGRRKKLISANYGVRKERITSITIAFLSENETDDSTSRAEEAEDWVEYIKRSTTEAEEKVRTYSTRCWIETQRKLKQRLAMRVASHGGKNVRNKEHGAMQAQFRNNNEQKLWQNEKKSGRRLQ